MHLTPEEQRAAEEIRHRYLNAKPTREEHPDDSMVKDLLRLFGKDFLLAWLARGSITLIPAFVRFVVRRQPTTRRQLLSSFGPHSIRFGLFIATFFTSYKGLYDLLVRVLARKQKLPKWLPNVLSGALSSLSLFLLDGPASLETRWLLAQYTAVRALQCLFEHWRSRHELFRRIGAHFYTALFFLSSGQLVYSFVTQPDALDHEYNGFLLRVTKMPPQIVQAFRSFLRDGHFDFNQLDAVLKKYPGEIGPESQRLQLLLRHVPRVVDCEVIHPEHPACLRRIASVWPYIFKMMFPVYLSLHTVPPLVFVYDRFLKQPATFLWTCVKNTVRSSSFMATYILLFQCLLCGHRELARHGWIKDDYALNYYLFGFLSSASVLIEKESRRTELALYLLPKAIVAFVRALQSKFKISLTLPHGELALFAVSMSILMSFQQHDPHCVSHVVSRILRLFQ